MNIDLLIKELTPLYNEYKEKSNTISGTEALIIMWDMGEILKNFLGNNDIAPHALYREVYGVSEGSSNVTKKSWITREFQGRCYRIRNIFKDKDQIYSELPSLVGFTAFRESMPFFDNKKYKLEGEDRVNLLKLLNSNKSKSFVKKEINKLQDQKIGISNDRSQRLVDLEVQKKIFIDFYNYVYYLKDKDNQEIVWSLKEKSVDVELIKTVAKNSSALSTDGLRFYEFDEEKIKRINADIPEKPELGNWISYIDVLKDFINQTNPKKIRRFRRLIKPEIIVRLSDMLNQVIKDNSSLMLSQKDQSDSDHFSKIEFTIGGWDSSSTLILEGGKILVFPYPGFNIGNDSPAVNHSPSNEEWLEFSKSLDQLNVENWKRSYQYRGIEDGTQWHLKIQTKSSKIDTGGSNAYPENFNGLLKAINMLINNDYFNEGYQNTSRYDPKSDTIYI
jgi:hypothetical protein